MSISVGKGFIPGKDRGFLYADSGDDTNDGTTAEKPKKTIQGALDATQALVPPPSISSFATVAETQGGVYAGDVSLYDYVLFEGRQTTIQSTGLVAVSGASFISFNSQTIDSSGDNSTALLCDGLTSFGANLSALLVRGLNSKGIEIKGSNNNVFFSFSQLSLAGIGDTGIDVTGESGSPIDVNINVSSFDSNDTTLLNLNPSSASTSIDVNVSSVFKGMTLPINTKVFVVDGGIVKARAGSLDADVIGDISNGILSLSCNAINGNTIARVGGNIIYDTVGFITGDLETVGTGSIQVRSSIITGNATNANNMSVKCDSFMGDIVNDGVMYVVIGDHQGTLTNNGVINGIIGDTYYGDWKAALNLKADKADVLGYVLATWGANLQTLGRHPAINSPSNSAEITSLGIMASMPVPASGILDTLTYYNNTGDNTTALQIVLNGVVVYTFTCTAPYGIETGIGIPVGDVGGVPDNVAIRYSAGTAPSEGLYTAYIK